MSANNSGNQDLSGASNVQNTRTYSTRSNPKGIVNKNDNYDGYSSATSKRTQRKTNPKPPVVPNNRRVFAAGQEITKATQQQIVTPVAPYTSMDMDLETRLNHQAFQEAMDTSVLQDSNNKEKPGKSPEELYADMQTRIEIQAAARDALKKRPIAVTSDASPDHMIIDDDADTSSKGKAKDTTQQVSTTPAGSSVLS